MNVFQPEPGAVASIRTKFHKSPQSANRKARSPSNPDKEHGLEILFLKVSVPGFQL